MRRSNSTTSFQRSHAFFFSRFFIRLMILSAPWSWMRMRRSDSTCLRHCAKIKPTVRFMRRATASMTMRRRSASSSTTCAHLEKAAFIARLAKRLTATFSFSRMSRSSSSHSTHR